MKEKMEGKDLRRNEDEKENGRRKYEQEGGMEKVGRKEHDKKWNERKKQRLKESKVRMKERNEQRQRTL
jgi:hypothetical protein